MNQGTKNRVRKLEQSKHPAGLITARQIDEETVEINGSRIPYADLDRLYPESEGWEVLVLEIDYVPSTHPRRSK